MSIRFWCCMVDGSGGFSHRHETMEDANLEAVRLARKERKRVYILEAVSYCQLQVIEPPIEWGTLLEKEG